MDTSETGTMTAEPSYFDMGGYAAFVWPAYGIALVALAGLVIWTVNRTRAAERRAARLRREAEQ